MSNEQHTCCQRVIPREQWGVFHAYPCGKSAIFERNGKWYCRRHDPEAVKARNDAKPKCQYVYEWGEKDSRCETIVSGGNKYCSFHASVEIGRDRYMELLRIEAEFKARQEQEQIA